MHQMDSALQVVRLVLRNIFINDPDYEIQGAVASLQMVQNWEYWWAASLGEKWANMAVR